MSLFQKVRFVFQISQYPKKIFQKTILNLKFKIPAHNIILLWAGILNFKFRIVFWNIFFWEIGRFEKQITLSEKKPPLAPFACFAGPATGSWSVWADQLETYTRFLPRTARKESYVLELKRS
mgnify:CR=1 FL=1